MSVSNFPELNHKDMDEKKTNPQIEVVDIDSLIPDDRNFNAGTDEGKQLIARSFREHGAGRSVLLDMNNRLVAGNKATDGAREAGIRKVIIVDTAPDELVAVRRIGLSVPAKREAA